MIYDSKHKHQELHTSERTIVPRKVTFVKEKLTKGHSQTTHVFPHHCFHTNFGTYRWPTPFLIFLHRTPIPPIPKVLQKYMARMYFLYFRLYFRMYSCIFVFSFVFPHKFSFVFVCIHLFSFVFLHVFLYFRLYFLCISFININYKLLIINTNYKCKYKFKL